MRNYSPRAQVSLDSEMFDLLKAIAKQEGKSISAVIAGHLEPYREGFRALVDAAPLLEKMSDERFQELKQTIEGIMFNSNGHALAAGEAMQDVFAVASGTTDPVQIDLEDYLQFKLWCESDRQAKYA